MNATIRYILVLLVNASAWALGMAPDAMWAANIGINFRENTNAPNTLDLGNAAGVVPQIRWNNGAVLASGTTTNIASPVAGVIYDAGGASTGATIAWNANGFYYNGGGTQPNPKLFTGYLNDTTTAGSTTVSLANLNYQRYDVVAYVGSDVDGRTGRIGIAGQDTYYYVTNAAAQFGGDGSPQIFTQATATTQVGAVPSNYVRWNGLSGTSFALNNERVTGDTGLFGLQVIDQSQAISIDFQGQNTTAMAASEVAGVVPRRNWNNAAGSNGTVNNLVIDSGWVSGASVSWTSQGVWNTNAADSSGNSRMMRGYLEAYGSGSGASVTVSDVPFSNYDVYVYFDGDNGANWRVGQYTITGIGSLSGEDSENTNFGSGQNTAGLFQHPVAGAGGNAAYPSLPNNNEGNFVVFRNVNLDSFLLTALGSATGDGAFRAPINGIQIVATAGSAIIPEPTSGTLGTMALLGLAFVAWRRRGSKQRLA